MVWLSKPEGDLCTQIGAGLPSEYWPSLSLPPPPPRRRRRRRTISSFPSATPRSCTRRCPTNPPSSTLLDATSCSACMPKRPACWSVSSAQHSKTGAADAHVLPAPSRLERKLGLSLSKLINHIPRSSSTIPKKNHRRTSHSFEETRLEFRQRSPGLARTTAHTTCSNSLFFFWKKNLAPTVFFLFLENTWTNEYHQGQFGSPLPRRDPKRYPCQHYT
jgi:hypothetical protein